MARPEGNRSQKWFEQQRVELKKSRAESGSNCPRCGPVRAFASAVGHICAACFAVDFEKACLQRRNFVLMNYRNRMAAARKATDKNE